MKYPHLICLLLFTQTLFGQPSEKDVPVVNDGFVINVMPFSFATRFPRARIGGELLTGRWSYLLDIEYGNSTTLGIVRPNRDRNASFFGLRPEIRYRPGTWQGREYIGLEVPVSVFQKDFRGVFRSDRDGEFRVEAARQERVRFSAVLKLGEQFVVGRHWLLDVYVGAGIGYRKLNYTGRVNQRPHDGSSDDEYCMVVCDLSDVRSGIIAELAFGLRVGYRLGR